MCFARRVIAHDTPRAWPRSSWRYTRTGCRGWRSCGRTSSGRAPARARAGSERRRLRRVAGAGAHRGARAWNCPCVLSGLRLKQHYVRDPLPSRRSPPCLWLAFGLPLACLWQVDRRQTRDRITFLKRQIEDVSRHRAQHRKHRKEAGVPTVALVGYTNAGKRWRWRWRQRARVLIPAAASHVLTLELTATRIVFQLSRPLPRYPWNPRFPLRVSISISLSLSFLQPCSPTVRATAARSSMP